MPGFIDRVRSFDAAPKIEYDFLQRTSMGACVSLVSIALMVILCITELNAYFTPNLQHELQVDVSRGKTFEINIDIVFPRLSCSLIALDVENGEKQSVKIDMHQVYKTRLNADGSVHSDSEDQLVKLGGTLQSVDEIKGVLNGSLVEDVADDEAEAITLDGCGSCYGAGDEGQCCNTCAEIRNAYRKRGWAFNLETTVEMFVGCKKERVQYALEDENNEGCRLKGHVNVPLADGNIHFAPARDFEHAPMRWDEIFSYTYEVYDLSHRINSFSIGPTFPSAKYPLAGVDKDMNLTKSKPEETEEEGHTQYYQNGFRGPDSGMFQYYLKVVPTDYEQSESKVQSTFQYAVTEHFRHMSSHSSSGVPGVYFFYEVSPIRMRIRELGSSFGHFLTNLCAIVGGTFTVMGMLDAFLHSLSQGGGKLVVSFNDTRLVVNEVEAAVIFFCIVSYAGLFSRRNTRPGSSLM